MTRFCLIILYVFSSLNTYSTPTDSSAAFLIIPTASFHLPSGELYHRFGPDISFGGFLLKKNTKQLLFGLNFNYFLGNTVKEDIFANLITSEGSIISSDGTPAEIGVYERGFCIGFSIGKVFAVNTLKNYGNFTFLISPVFIQHWIGIETMSNVPSLQNDYIKGYDRLTNGGGISEFIGYTYLSKNKRINFFAGIELIQTITKNRRERNFSTRTSENQTRFDLLHGIRLGWVIPIYLSKKQKFYYN